MGDWWGTGRTSQKACSMRVLPDSLKVATACAGESREPVAQAQGASVTRSLQRTMAE